MNTKTASPWAVLAVWLLAIWATMAGCPEGQGPGAPKDGGPDLAADGAPQRDTSTPERDTSIPPGDLGRCEDHCRNGQQDCGEVAVDCGEGCRPCAESEGEIYLDPLLGDDVGGEGSRERPFRSLTRGRDAVRALRVAEPQRATPVRVVLRGGTYSLAETLTLEGPDSGTAASPAIYRAFADELPVVSGGQVIEGWQVGTAGWTLTLPRVVSDGWAFTQLWVDGERRRRPRLPKQKHYFIHRKAASTDAEGRDNRFGFRGDEIQAGWRNLADVEVLAWHHWTISRLRIASVDQANRIVTFSGPTRCTETYCQLLPGYRYLVENVREALDEPGQWYLDAQSGELSYLPLPGEAPGQTTVIAPRLRVLLQLGDSESSTPLEHVIFEGIHFAHTHWPTPPAGYSGRQSEVDLSAAIELAQASHCALRRCTISHTGAWGVHLGSASHDNRIEGCELTDLGAGGIHVGPASLADGAEAAQRNTIRDNLIVSGGRMHPAGVGVLISNAAHTTVEHNDIADFYYTGISVGWNWGYTTSSAHHNVIAYNHVHKIGQGVLSDLGGIYTLGISPGTHIHHNVFHDVYRNRYGGWGIYFDQASSNILAEFNLVYDTQDTPFHLHFGEDNTLRNNIWIAEHAPLLRRSKPEERHTVTVERNVFYSSAGPQVLRGDWSDDRYTFDHNLYWSTSGDPLDFGGRSLAQWQAEGQDLHSMAADPLFNDSAHRDYSFAAGSPASQLGIDPVDVSQAGRLSAPRSTGLTLPPRAFPAAEGIAPIDIDFEEMTPGQVPTVGRVHEGDGSGSLRVTDASGAHGTAKSLLFEDAADLTHAYNPHYVLLTRHAEGSYRVAFSLRWNGGADIYLEWRDWRITPYVTGPLIRIMPADGGVVVNGQTLATLPAGQWVDFEITAKLGAQADGTFDLALQPAGQARQTFPGLPCVSPSFGYVDWIGFVSNATSATTFGVDEIEDATL